MPGEVRDEWKDREITEHLYQQARHRLLANEPLLAQRSKQAAQALSAGEVRALQAVGLSTMPFAGEKTRDPLLRSIGDYMALLETSLTTAQAAKHLKVDVSRVRQRLRERSLYGIEYEREHRLPRFQFERGRALPGLADVLAALPAGLNPLDVAEWFLSPHPDLEAPGHDEGMSPRQWLLAGRSIAAVTALAKLFE
ncbi:MAG: hypothetical protein JSS24_03440 [Proteobacteria bacterium]|nr:hypothetical protein [Pseudomonadota bacterium]